MSWSMDFAEDSLCKVAVTSWTTISVCVLDMSCLRCFQRNGNPGAANVELMLESYK